MKHFHAGLFLLLFLPFTGLSQYTATNAAQPLSSSPGSTCFLLTPSDFYQKGAVWSNNTINLAQSFDIRAKLYFGDHENGADGIAFVLQKEGPGYIGNFGAGIGYHRFNGENALMPVDVPGPVPSFIVEFDTWQNGDIYGQNIGDPVGDHVGFMSNSNAYHTMAPALAPPVEISANIEDGQWHDVRFIWNASTKQMTVQFTVSASPLVVQTFSYSGDIVNNIFGGNGSNVYWGFTASTGSFTPSEQRVCFVTPPGDCGQLRTQTPGGWGAPPRGNNPASYMYSHFAAAFPAGLTVGLTPNYNIRLTSPQAVTNFLPCGGPAKKLTQNFLNPASSTVKNTLAGHLVALTLSVTFDQADPSFGTAGINLGSMLIKSGPFANWTVSDFLVEANRILGGASSSYSVQDALSTATSINENYVDGSSDKKFLLCPNNEGPRRINNQQFSVAAPVLELNDAAEGLSLFPNPSKGQVELRFGNSEGPVQVMVTNMNGVVVEKRNLTLVGKNQSARFNLDKLPSGMYLVRVVSASGENVQKLVIRK